jgi:hypothetical protein
VVAIGTEAVKHQAIKLLKPIKVAINTGKSKDLETQSAVINHSNWNTLLQKNVSKNGTVNYKGFQKTVKLYQPI